LPESGELLEKNIRNAVPEEEDPRDELIFMTRLDITQLKVSCHLLKSG